MDPLKICKKIKQPDISIVDKLKGLFNKKKFPNEYEVPMGKLYPTTIAYIKDVLSRDNISFDKGLESKFILAQNLPDRSWDLALEPREKCDNALDLEFRTQALELSRLIFTRMLHLQINEIPMTIHITCTKKSKIKYRL